MVLLLFGKSVILSSLITLPFPNTFMLCSFYLVLTHYNDYSLYDFSGLCCVCILLNKPYIYKSHHLSGVVHISYYHCHGRFSYVWPERIYMQTTFGKYHRWRPLLYAAAQFHYSKFQSTVKFIIQFMFQIPWFSQSVPWHDPKGTVDLEPKL